ncbi:MAG: DUF502 domain-containing protein [Candidatus Omnitrophota bacterium]|nr:DUF502 domain-containing protein [Candidatus Omnitrophota bacterium]
MSNIKHYFGAGLLITLPVFLTVYLLYIVFRFIDGIWGKVINFYLMKYFGFTIPGLGFILGILTIFIIGFIATKITNKKMFKMLESWFLRFPFISIVYPSARQIINSIFSKESPAFKKVVLVEYPSKGVWSVGFLTNDSFKQANDAAGAELLHVFIGTTPTPLSGFLTLIPKSQVKILDISIEAGIKLIVSGGIVKP